MDRAELIQGLAQILELDAAALADDEPVETMLWDSIEIMGAIALLDRAGVIVKVADILGCRSMGDLVRLAGCASPCRPPAAASPTPNLVPSGRVPGTTTSTR